MIIRLLLVSPTFVQFECAPGKNVKQACMKGEGNRHVGESDSHEIRMIGNGSVGKYKIIAYLRHGGSAVLACLQGPSSHFPSLQLYSVAHSGA